MPTKDERTIDAVEILTGCNSMRQGMAIHLTDRSLKMNSTARRKADSLYTIEIYIFYVRRPNNQEEFYR